MSIEFKPGRFFICMFSMPVPRGHVLLNSGGDIFGALYTDDLAAGQATVWTLLWRLRIHRDQKVWDSADTRKWWTGTIKKNRTEALGHVKNWLQAIAQVSDREADVLMLDCDGSEAPDKVTSASPSWLHQQESHAV